LDEEGRIMDIVAIESSLYEILSLVELAQSDHPEDYTLDEIQRELTLLIMEVE
jgi:hypothetical protein